MNKTDKNQSFLSSMELAEKIAANCSLSSHVVYPNVFSFHNKHLAEKITEKGKKFLHKLIDKNMGKICINGKTYEFTKGNISVINNEVYCDGKLVSNLNEIPEKEIKISIEGNIEGDLNVSSADIKVTGDVKGSVQTQSGDIEIDGAVGGSISTMSGDVECGKVGGSISTMSGNIKNKK